MECYKTHQANHLAPSQSTPNGLPPKSSAAVASTGASSSHVSGGGPPFGTFVPSSLESSTDLQKLYTRYPQLQNQLKGIYEAAMASLDDQLNSQSFRGDCSDRGRGRGRHRGRGSESRISAPWSRPKGITAGVHRLRLLRRTKGEDGDGLREFSRLVTSTFQGKPSTVTAPEFA